MGTNPWVYRGMVCVTLLESTGHCQVYGTLYSREYHKKSLGNKSLPTSSGTKCQPLFISGVGQAPYKSTQISTIKHGGGMKGSKAQIYKFNVIPRTKQFNRHT